MKTFVRAKSAWARLLRTSLLGMARVLATARPLQAQSPVIKKCDKTIGGGQVDKLFAQLSTGKGYVLAGASNSNSGGDKFDNSRGGHDYWVVTIDTNGNKLWDNTLGETVWID